MSAYVARRSRVALSAGGEGAIPAAASFASRKRSIGLAAFPAGTLGEAIGWKLHQLLRTVSRSDQAGGVDSVGARSRGSGAPRFTHSAKSATILASSFGRFFGICSVSWLWSMD